MVHALLTIMKVALFSSPIFTLLILQVGGIVPDGNSSNSIADSLCRAHEKCFQCIQTMGCMWCKDKNPSLESRCFSNQSLTIQCKDIENPRGSLKERTGDEEKLKGDGTYKIRPQVVELSLRKGEKRNVTLEYTDEKSRPLDLYILMDLSCSMKKHKETVSNLTSTLEKNLKKLTSDLRMGFGSFVDKPLAPFGFLAPDPTNSKECEGEKLQSIPYSFKNHLRLTDNVTQFIDGVNAAGISSNIEHPEGTLEGLLQSIVCTGQIGWRTGKENRSRKLVVISTDGSFHLAGDGKLVGVVLPHDGVCYVDQSGIYTGATVFDYPSVSLVRQKLKENDIFVIFAVTKDQEKAYSQLSQQLDQYAVTQSIDNNDNSIISVIGDEYKKLVNTTTMLSDYDQKDYVGIKIYVKCPNEKDFLESNQCNEVGPGVTVSFKIEVELKDCPSKSSNPDAWKSKVSIYPLSSSEDNMLIQLSMLCGCDCEAESPSKTLKGAELSPECSNHGFVQCGICACETKFGGPFCNCTTDDTGSVSMDQCVDPKTGTVCNDRGTCDSCGKCTCDAVDGNSNARSGKYCECDNTNCPFERGVDHVWGLCNKNAEDGPHGECECSRCKCEEKFNGSRCECPTNDKNCRDPNSPEDTCNGIGSCYCGKCICNPQTNKGKFCEIQYARLNGSCDAARLETEKCVKCLVSRYSISGETDGAKTEHCEESCTGIAIVFSSRIEILTVEEEENACKDFEIDKNECRIDYIIKHKDITSGKILLEIDEGETVTRDKCPTPANVLGIVIAIIGAMVLIGIFLLLAWKVVTHVQDKREYERFEKAINETSWETQQNPLYKPTTSQFQNPAYIDYSEN